MIEQHKPILETSMIIKDHIKVLERKNNQGREDYIKRLYTYFKRHTAYTDLIHIVLGLGIGFIIAGGVFYKWGIVFLLIGISGHVYAFFKRK